MSEAYSLALRNALRSLYAVGVKPAYAVKILHSQRVPLDDLVRALYRAFGGSLARVAGILADEDGLHLPHVVLITSFCRIGHPLYDVAYALRQIGVGEEEIARLLRAHYTAKRIVAALLCKAGLQLSDERIASILLSVGYSAAEVAEALEEWCGVSPDLAREVAVRARLRSQEYSVDSRLSTLEEAVREDNPRLLDIFDASTRDVLEAYRKSVEERSKLKL